jgi:hypothetical protein
MGERLNYELRSGFAMPPCLSSNIQNPKSKIHNRLACEPSLSGVNGFSSGETGPPFVASAKKGGLASY